MHTCIHAFNNTHMHPYIHAYSHTHMDHASYVTVHSYRHTHARTYIHKCKNTRAHTQICKHTCMYTCIHTSKGTCTLSFSGTRTYTDCAHLISRNPSSFLILCLNFVLVADWWSQDTDCGHTGYVAGVWCHTKWPHFFFVWSCWTVVVKKVNWCL